MELIKYVIEIPTDVDEACLNFTYIMESKYGSEYIKNQLKNKINTYLEKKERIENSTKSKLFSIFKNNKNEEDSLDSTFELDGYFFDISLWEDNFYSIEDIEITVTPLNEWITELHDYCKKEFCEDDCQKEECCGKDDT